MHIQGGKGQTSVEFVVVLAILLSVFIIIFAMGQKTYYSSKEAIKSVQARAVLKDIVNAANLVHSQGENAKTKIYIKMPEGVVDVNISGKCIYMGLYIGGEIHSIPEECAETCLTGEVPVRPGGSYWINLQSRRNCVLIGEPKLQVNPSALNFAIYIDEG